MDGKMICFYTHVSKMSVKIDLNRLDNLFYIEVNYVKIIWVRLD